MGHGKRSVNPRARFIMNGFVLTGVGEESGFDAYGRLEQLFEERCDAFARRGESDRLAATGVDLSLSYHELDRRANQLARYLVSQGLRAGERVGLLLDQAVSSYVAMLAVLKAHAVYVPLDAAAPADRLSFIAADAAIRVLLTKGDLAGRVADLELAVRVVNLDTTKEEIARERDHRLKTGDVATQPDDLCYVIYTSGTTGRPKGVFVSHPSICNFVRVAARLYGLTADDRVYQGLTIAFDFSFEEIWVPWMVGATLVPKPDGTNLVGADLTNFLRAERVTALCCVPTVLATIEPELPDLRFLLVSGEACPQDLITRWYRPGLRFLNTYGPTEATVSATWALLRPDQPVTIGVPLPTYHVVILNPEADQALPPGQLGEIGIAGVGLAGGYLNRPELTERAFVPDFLDLPDNPSRTIYRTGDLGRINEEGEIEYHGRIDSQVKIRGYRIELGEVESILREVPGVGQVVVAAYEGEAGTTELVAYHTGLRGASAVDADDLLRHLRERLPTYMVPAYLELLDAIPLTISGKVDRARLPAPTTPRHRNGHAYVAPASETEVMLVEQLAQVLGVPEVSVESDFFNDLGANSLLIARFNARLREQVRDLPPVSMRAVYANPTVRQLAASLTRSDAGSPVVPATVESTCDPLPAIGRGRFGLCGALQLLVGLGYASLAMLALGCGAQWLVASHDAAEFYAKAIAFGACALAALVMVPIAAKWILVGRFRSGRIRLWSMAYLRFWIVKTLIVANPVARSCAGTPLYNLYLRALGAKIGPGAVIFTHHVPVCTDLLEVGAGSVVRRDTYMNGYRAQGDVIEIGSVTIGPGAFVGEQTVLDIDSALAQGAQLGHSSSLQSGQVVPAGECWHGSPAQPAGPGVDYQQMPASPSSRARRAGLALAQLWLLVAVLGPLEAVLATLGFAHPRFLAHVSAGDVFAAAALIVFGGLLAALAVALTVPRVLTRFLQPGRVYPLFGVHYALQRAVQLASNMRILTSLFGDSSAIVYYLRALGYRFGTIVQTGTNFGMNVHQEIPALSEVGAGTMVSDGLVLMNAEFSSTSFRVLPAVIGKANFLGNNIRYPAGGRTGDNCLLATKAMIPIIGDVHHDVGLLGSPCFEIPRTVNGAEAFREATDGPHQRRRLAAKARHNAATMALFLGLRFLYVLGLVSFAVGSLERGRAATLETLLIDAAFSLAFFLSIERILVHLRPLQPRTSSIYAVEFWRHERYWKVPGTAYFHAFDGTAFKGLFWRLLGVRVGNRLYDDGCHLTERTLVSLGDDCSLNMGSELQSHSLEEGVFKSDRIDIRSRCTVGTAAWVHYGTLMDEGSVLEADAFLMKGSHTLRGGRWRGNPAAEVTTTADRRTVSSGTQPRSPVPAARNQVRPVELVGQ